jgi:hypothetical protein
MFKNHKLELKLVKDRKTEAGLVDATPAITKEDVIHIAKNVGRIVVAGVLVVLVSDAAIDTAKHAAKTGIDNRSNRKKLER